MKTLKMTLIAVSLVLGLAIAVYAGSVTIEGTAPDDLVDDEPFECSKGGKMCVTIRDVGPNFDNVFVAGVGCDNRAETVRPAKKPGKKAKACVRCPSGIAEYELGCNETAGPCNDNFTAKLTCKGEVIAPVP